MPLERVGVFLGQDGIELLQQRLLTVVGNLRYDQGSFAFAKIEPNGQYTIVGFGRITELSITGSSLNIQLAAAQL